MCYLYLKGGKQFCIEIHRRRNAKPRKSAFEKTTNGIADIEVILIVIATHFEEKL